MPIGIAEVRSPHRAVDVVGFVSKLDPLSFQRFSPTANVVHGKDDLTRSRYIRRILGQGLAQDQADGASIEKREAFKLLFDFNSQLVAVKSH